MLRYRRRLTPLLLIGAAAVAFPTASQAQCFYCACNDKLYAEIGTCNAECSAVAGLGCFNSICGPGELPGDPPTPEQDQIERSWFPKLTCYRVIQQPRIPPPDDEPNCLAWVVGESRYVWEQVLDKIYGNRDGQVDVWEMDAYLSMGGYSTSETCAHEDDKEKIALFGYPRPDGTIEPSHVAKESALSAPGGPWWESKEGKYKVILHKLYELEGDRIDQGDYGRVVKCYERPL